MEVDLSAAGEPKQHELKIIFDPAKQMVGLKFDAAEFKTFDFVIAVLGMATEAANAMKRAAVKQHELQQEMALKQSQRILHGMK